MNEIIKIKQTTKNVRIFGIGSFNFFDENWNTSQPEKEPAGIKKKKQ